jgi:hypothetical protein
MRFASWTPVTLVVFAALGCAIACGDDDDDMPNNTAGTKSDAGEDGGGGTGNGAGTAGTAGKGGSSSTAAGEGGGGPIDSQLCTDLGGPGGIDAVVRGDGKTAAADPFNGFKFEKDGRQASVLLNVATDPCIGQQFAHLLAPAKAADLEHLAQCLSLFVQNAAGCAVPYAGAKDSEGVACKSMTAAHVGLGITEEDYTALVMDAATALFAAGLTADSPQFMAVAGALTADELKADVITSEDGGFSQPGAMCEAAAGSDGAGGAASGGGGAGGAP